MTTIGATNAAGIAPKEPTQAEQAKTAGKQLEAFFMRQLLTEARPQGGGGIDGGFAGDTFKQMLDEALADKMSGAGGIGLADMFARQLDPSASVAAKAPLTGEFGAHHAGLPMPATTIDDGARVGPQLGDAPRFIMPTTGRASSGYGARLDPINHTSQVHPGFDLAAPSGTRVNAAAAGEVVHAGPAGTYGNLVIVRHTDGFETRYAHLSKVDVKKGETVVPGQDVGEVGTTGHSTGPHLHFEIRKEGKALDPKPYLPLNPPPIRTTR